MPSSRFRAVYDAVGGASAPAQMRAAIAAMDDTMTALDFLHPRPDVAPSQTVLWGSSAGAITALYVGFAMDDFEIEPPRVSAVISNSGGFAGGNGADTYIEDDDRKPAVFMTHSTGDPTVDFQLAQDIADRAEAVGLPYELFTVDAVSHGLPDGLFQTDDSPGVSVFQAQVNWLDGVLGAVPKTP